MTKERVRERKYQKIVRLLKVERTIDLNIRTNDEFLAHINNHEHLLYANKVF